MKFSNNIFTSPLCFKEGSHLFGFIATILVILYAIPFPMFHKYLGQIPNYFYSPNPFSVAYYFIPGIPSEPFIYFWEIVNLALLYGMLVSEYRSKFSYAVILTISLTLYFSIYYSFGKIDHNYANIMFLPFACMAISKENRWSMNTVFFILLFSFLSSGIYKLLDFSYLSWETQKVYTLIKNKTFLTWSDSFSDYPTMMTCFWELLDYGALFFEIGLVILVFFSYGYINLLIFFACVFHCLNKYWLNIGFTGQLYLYVYITFAMLYHYHPSLNIVLDKVLALLKNKYFYFFLGVLFLLQIWIMHYFWPPSIIRPLGGFYTFYIVLGFVNLYLFRKAIVRVE